MKKKLFIYLLFLYIFDSNICWSQITNGNFETWSIGTTGFLDPDGWYTSNYAPNLPSVIQATGHTGNYCVRLKTVYDNNAGNNFGGLIEFKNYSSIRPIGVSGFWKINQTGAFPIDELYMDFRALYQSTQISILNVSSQINISNWTPFNYTFSYNSSAIPDYFSLSFDFATASPTSLAGYGDIDDLALTYITGLNDTIVAHYPAINLLRGNSIDSYNIYIDILAREQFTIQMFDIHGKMISNSSCMLPAGHKEISLDVSSFSSGQYLYVVTLGSKKQCFRISKL